MFLLYFVAIFSYNLLAVLVTYMLDSVWHAILDNFRPISVWGVDLALFYVVTSGAFGEAWAYPGSYVQVAALGVLLYGTAVYNGSVKVPGCSYPPDAQQPQLLSPMVVRASPALASSRPRSRRSSTARRCPAGRWSGRRCRASEAARARRAAERAPRQSCVISLSVYHPTRRYPQLAPARAVVEVRVAHEAEAAVLAVRRDGGVHRVERDVLDRVAERAAAAVAGRDVALHLDDGHLGDERLGVAPVGVHVLHGVAAARAEGAHGRWVRARRREPPADARHQTPTSADGSARYFLFLRW